MVSTNTQFTYLNHPMNKTKKLIIFGIGDFAQIAYEYFTHDSEYEVCAFCVDSEYITSEKMFGIAIYCPEKLIKICTPQEEYYFYAAIIYGKLNDDRTKVYNKLKTLGYKPASYISSKASVWKNCEIKEHTFIFENNIIQPFTKIGRNVVLWSGNHIGHHSKIEDNCFISSHAVISGHCIIEKNCFIGVNSTISNNIRIGERSWVSHGAIISNNVEKSSFVRAINSETRKLNENALLKSLDKINKIKSVDDCSKV